MKKGNVLLWVIIVIIVLGGLYFWGERTSNGAMSEADTEEMVNKINAQSSSDEASVIQSDLESTNVENLDTGLNSL